MGLFFEEGGWLGGWGGGVEEDWGEKKKRKIK